jgi:hypothetical protein
VARAAAQVVAVALGPLVQAYRAASAQVPLAALVVQVTTARQRAAQRVDPASPVHLT